MFVSVSLGRSPAFVSLSQNIRSLLATEQKWHQIISTENLSKTQKWRDILKNKFREKIKEFLCGTQ